MPCRIFTHSLENVVPEPAADFDRAYERALAKLAEQMNGFRFAADLFRRLQCESAPEDGQLREKPLYLARQKVVTRVKRGPQRRMAAADTFVAADKEIETCRQA